MGRIDFYKELGNEPRANAIRGTYFLDIPYSNNDILGVYRCEILSKEQIIK